MRLKVRGLSEIAVGLVKTARVVYPSIFRQRDSWNGSGYWECAKRKELGRRHPISGDASHSYWGTKKAKCTGQRIRDSLKSVLRFWAESCLSCRHLLDLEFEVYLPRQTKCNGITNQSWIKNNVLFSFVAKSFDKT